MWEGGLRRKPRGRGIPPGRAHWLCAGSPAVSGRWGWSAPLKPPCVRGPCPPAHRPPDLAQAAAPPTWPLGLCTLNSKRHSYPCPENFSASQSQRSPSFSEALWLVSGCSQPQAPDIRAWSEDLAHPRDGLEFPIPPPPAPRLWVLRLASVSSQDLLTQGGPASAL